MKVIIVGGVAGGASCAARLRRLDETARILMVERGPYVSFANCGLPYYLGGEIAERGKLLVQTPQRLREVFNLDVRVRSEVVALDREAREVEVRDLGQRVDSCVGAARAIELEVRALRDESHGRGDLALDAPRRRSPPARRWP